MKYFLIFVLVVHCLVSAQSAVELAEKGKLALQQSQFEEAAKLYREAAKAVPSNQEYTNLALFLRNVVTLRAKLPEQKDIRRWAQMALSLRSFYMEHKLYQEVNTISQQIYEKFNNPVAAYMRGEGYILTQQNEQAIEFLSNLKEKTTPFTKVLLGIAQARVNQTDSARAISQELKQEALQQPAFCYYFAVLETLLQNQESALECIAKGMQNTLPSQMDVYRKLLLENQELQALQKNPLFAKTMQTQSIIPESSCSGGSTCGSCPSRNSCNSQKKPSSACGTDGCTDDGCGKK